MQSCLFPESILHWSLPVVTQGKQTDLCSDMLLILLQSYLMERVSAGLNEMQLIWYHYQWCCAWFRILSVTWKHEKTSMTYSAYWKENIFIFPKRKGNSWYFNPVHSAIFKLQIPAQRHSTVWNPLIKFEIHRNPLVLLTEHTFAFKHTFGRDRALAPAGQSHLLSTSHCRWCRFSIVLAAMWSGAASSLTEGSMWKVSCERSLVLSPCHIPSSSRIWAHPGAAMV